MSFDTERAPVVIDLQGVAKRYPRRSRPGVRLWQALLGRQDLSGEAAFVALHPCHLSVRRGEVVGLVGKNGAGKSTLLQLLSRTLEPTEGQVQVQGRVSAILELGSGFNPEFSGRENIHLAMATAGLSRAHTLERIEEIIAFSGIEEFIDQPLKTYSSGMQVRLAFSVATCAEPEILVIDEALSVGDGEFARKSFDRIMALKEAGTTILFCSHSLFQIEAICSRAIWLHGGKVVLDGQPAQVVSAYQAFLDGAESSEPGETSLPQHPAPPKGHARLLQIKVGGLDISMGPLHLKSLQDDLTVEVDFASDPTLPCPSLAVTLHAPDGRILSSAGAWNDGFELQRDEMGRGAVALSFTQLPLLKGRYYVSVHLFCERGLHTYDAADRAMYVMVEQSGIEQGLVHLPHRWSSPEAASTPQQRPSSLDASVSALLDWLVAHAWPLTVGETVILPDARMHGLASLASRFGLVQQPDGAWLKTRMPRWQLGWIRSGQSSAAWLELFQACFGHAMPEGLWRWKYGQQELAGTGVFAAGELIGFYGGLPRRVLMHGQPAMGLQICDVMVHPSQRGVLTRRGPFFLSCVTLLEQLMGFGRPFLLGFGFPSRKHLDIAKRLGIYEAVDQIAEVSWTTCRTLPDWRLRTRTVKPQDKDDVNSCWASMAHAMKASVLGVRDWDFISWRYLNHPVVNYTVLLVRKRLSGLPLGVLVLRDREEEGIELLDLVGAPENFAALVRAAVRHAHLLGRERLFGWVTRSHKQLLDVRGAQFADLDIWIPANVWTDGPPAQELDQQWWLMAGDSDFR